MVPCLAGSDLRWPCLTCVLLPVGLVRLSVVVGWRSFVEVHRGGLDCWGWGEVRGKLRGGTKEHRSEMRWSCSALLEGGPWWTSHRVHDHVLPCTWLPVGPLLSSCCELSKIDDRRVICSKISVPGPWMRSFGGRQSEWQAGRRGRVVRPSF